MDRKESYKMPDLLEADLLEVGSIVNVIKKNSVLIGAHEYKGIQIFPVSERRPPEMLLDCTDEEMSTSIPLTQIISIDVLSSPIEGLED